MEKKLRNINLVFIISINQIIQLVKYKIGDKVRHITSGKDCTVFATKFETGQIPAIVRPRLISPIDDKDYALVPIPLKKVPFYYANEDELELS